MRVPADGAKAHGLQHLLRQVPEDRDELKRQVQNKQEDGRHMEGAQPLRHPVPGNAQGEEVDKAHSKEDLDRYADLGGRCPQENRGQKHEQGKACGSKSRKKDAEKLPSRHKKKADQKARQDKTGKSHVPGKGYQEDQEKAGSHADGCTAPKLRAAPVFPYPPKHRKQRHDALFQVSVTILFRFILFRRSHPRREPDLFIPHQFAPL